MKDFMNISRADPKQVTNGRAWTKAEDDIITELYGNPVLNLSVRDISKGLFHRTKSSVNGRIYLHRLFFRKFGNKIQ